AAVHRLEILLAANETQLGAVPVIGEGLDDIRAGMDEFAVQLLDELGMLEHDLRDEGAGLGIPAGLELEEIALGTDHRALRQPLHEAGVARPAALARLALHGVSPDFVCRASANTKMRTVATEVGGSLHPR